MKNTHITAQSPIACTLTGDDYKQRLAWIAGLARGALRSFEQRGLVLNLHYAIEAADQVREMVRKETACCAFLHFDLREERQAILLTISAPENAREMVGFLFQQFAGAQVPSPGPPSTPNLALE